MEFLQNCVNTYVSEMIGLSPLTLIGTLTETDISAMSKKKLIKRCTIMFSSNFIFQNFYLI